MEIMQISDDELRRKAFAIAYRMLGSVSEAEDIVQEALLRVHRALESGEHIESPQAYVSTVVTRLAIDELRSARVRRESYVGEWLPEPLVTRDDADPAQHAEMADSLSIAFLALLERLSPTQRAAFLLREVFDYPYERIAEIIGRSEPAVRQLASRARRQVEDQRPRFETSDEHRQRLADRFFAAIEGGDFEALESMLAADAVLHGDGGGEAPAITKPIGGRSRVARAIATWGQRILRARVEVHRIEVNGQPGATVVDPDGKLIGVMALDIAAGEIRAINSIVNPHKLAHLGLPMADLTALLRRER